MFKVLQVLKSAYCHGHMSAPAEAEEYYHSITSVLGDLDGDMELVVCKAGLWALKPRQPGPKSPSPAQPWVTALAGSQPSSRIPQAQAQPASLSPACKPGLLASVWWQCGLWSTSNTSDSPTTTQFYSHCLTVFQPLFEMGRQDPTPQYISKNVRNPWCSISASPLPKTDYNCIE